MSVQTAERRLPCSGQRSAGIPGNREIACEQRTGNVQATEKGVRRQREKERASSGQKICRQLKKECADSGK